MRLWLASGRRWGARTIHSQLGGDLAGATPCRVRRCMRELGIRGVCPPRRIRTTVPDPTAPDRPNLLRRDWAVYTLLLNIKDEFFRGQTWPDFESFKRNLDAYLVHWNTRRRQVKLKGLTPEEFRNQSLGLVA